MLSIKSLPITNKTKMLVIMPHPDDEAIFSAGFIYHAAKKGAYINILTMTNGEKSTLRYGVKDHQDLGKIRKNELEKACVLLQVHTLVCANFPDGEIEQKYKQVTKFVIEDIMEFHPDIILTLEPDGIYGHPDHIALSQIVTFIHKSKKIPFQLIYATVDDKFKSGEDSKKMAKKAVIKPLKPTHELKLSLDEEYVKRHTIMAHHSQFSGNDKFWQRWNKYNMFEKEYFVVVK